jgi:hypothetical protein
MTDSAPIFRKLTLDLQLFVKNFYNECYENPVNCNVQSPIRCQKMRSFLLLLDEC